MPFIFAAAHIAIVLVVRMRRLPLAGLADPPKLAQLIILLELDVQRVMAGLGRFRCLGHACGKKR